MDEVRMAKRNAEMLHSLCQENLKQRLLGRPGTDGKILKWTLKKEYGR